MSPTAADSLPTRLRDDAPPGLFAQRLVAVPWRHAGLIALCAVAGGVASTLPSLHSAPVHVAAARPRMQAIQEAPSPRPVAGIGLRLDPEPGAAAGSSGTMSADHARLPLAALRLDVERDVDEIDTVLRQAPPAAGRLVRATLAREPAAGERPNVPLPGLVAGLLLGLALAGVRELRGQRMRSPREAEWALGAPVLGAIPTLSARARDALLAPSPVRPDAA